MNKPEKKEVPECLNDVTVGTYESAYNQAIDDYEKFLPSEGEIHTFLTNKVFQIGGVVSLNNDANRAGIAKAIAKRIGKL